MTKHGCNNAEHVLNAECKQLKVNLKMLDIVYKSTKRINSRTGKVLEGADANEVITTIKELDRIKNELTKIVPDDYQEV